MAPLASRSFLVLPLPMPAAERSLGSAPQAESPTVWCCDKGAIFSVLRGQFLDANSNHSPCCSIHSFLTLSWFVVASVAEQFTRI